MRKIDLDADIARQELGRLRSLWIELREFALSHTFSEILKRAIDMAEELTSSRIGFFHSLDADQTELTLQAWSTNTLVGMCTAEKQGAHYPVEQAGVWVDCIQQRRPVVHNDYASLAHRKGLPDGHSQVIRELVVPIFRDERIAAILGVGNKPVDYTENDVQTLVEFSNLAWDVTSNKRAEQKIEDLARFPEENPNPVMRVDHTGRLLYANTPAKLILGEWNCEIGQILPQDWQGLATSAHSSGERITTEVHCNDRIYSITYLPIKGSTYVNVYGRDVTERIRAIEALQKAREELEERVRERTRALEIANEQLEAQVAERRRAEEALRSAYAYNRSLIEASLDPLVTIMADGKVGDVNMATELVTGYSRAELIGTDFHSYFTEPEKARAGYRQVFERGAVRDYPLEILHRDGHCTPVLYNASVYRNESGEVIGVFAAARDITQQLKAEQELKQQEMLLRTVLENLPVGVWITDAAGQIIQGNSAAQNIWAGARYIGISDYQEYKGWWVSTGKPIAAEEWAAARAIQKGEIIINEEVEIECFDGSHKIILNSAIPLRNAQQNILGTIVVNQDISEIKRAQRELEIDRQRLLQLSQAEGDQRRFAESLVKAMFALNSSLNLNEVLYRILEQIQMVIPFRTAYIALLEGEKVRIVRQRGAEDLPEIPDILRSNLPLEDFPIWKILSGSRQVILIPDTEDDPRWVSIPRMEWTRSFLAASLQIGESVVGFISILSDQPGFFDQEAAGHFTAFASQAELAIQNARLYRDLEKALAQEQRMRSQLVASEKFAAMGRMLASVAHELNNPLQTIQNCLFLTQQDTLSGSPIQEYLEMAFSEIGRLNRMLAQLREIYRPRSATVIQPNDICLLIDGAYALLAPHMQNHQVLWRQGPIPKDIYVSCDADQIKQVFINIVMNAVEAMQPNGGSVTIGVLRSDDGRQAGIEFRDTGPGISPEILPNLFEPFFTTKSSGLGLGLSICYELVQRHGGKITVESKLREGSVFTVWLPAAEKK